MSLKKNLFHDHLIDFDSRVLFKNKLNKYIQYSDTTFHKHILATDHFTGTDKYEQADFPPISWIVIKSGQAKLRNC